jgi:hypothetical protein
MRTRIEDDGTLSSNHTGQQKAYLTDNSVNETCIALIFTSRYQGRGTFPRLKDTVWMPLDMITKSYYEQQPKLCLVKMWSTNFKQNS